MQKNEDLTTKKKWKEKRKICRRRLLQKLLNLENNYPHLIH